LFIPVIFRNIAISKTFAMGAIKLGAYTRQQEELATFAKALAHPGRIAIVQELLKNQHCQCGELAATVGLAQSTISQHLKELKNAGIIKGSIDDDRLCYCLAGEGLQGLMDLLGNIIESTRNNLDNC
jgi:ArsR family transcriptional regulator, arsenate/arsenite/antimonite-responsive transcriptional repressor